MTDLTPRRVGERPTDALDDLLCATQAHAPGWPRAQVAQAVEQALLGPGAHALEAAQLPGGAAASSASSESMPAWRHSSPAVRGPKPGHLQQRHHRWRDIAAQAFVVLQAAGGGQLGELLVDGLADAGQPRWVAVAVGLGDVDRGVGDRLGCPAVGGHLERQLGADLEHVADLVEDARQLFVAQQRHVRVCPAVARRPNVDPFGPWRR